MRPTTDTEGVGPKEKLADQMTAEEKKKHDLEVKTHSTLTMALSRNIFHQICDIGILATSYVTLRARSMGNTQESKKAMLNYQNKNFNIFPNETVSEMLTR